MSEPGIARVGFWMGWLELGFVLYASTVFSQLLFIVWSGSGCIALMWPRIRAGVGRAKPLPPNAAGRGSDAQAS